MTRGIAHWYILLTDIEERTQALARLEQMQLEFAHQPRGMMGETTSLSHEISQPINSARNNACAAQGGPRGHGRGQEALSCVVGDADGESSTASVIINKGASRSV